MRAALLLLLPAMGIAGVCSNTSLGNGMTCVQSAKCTSGAAAVASQTCSFGSLPAVGNFVVISAGAAASSFFTPPTDNQSNTYHTDVTLGSGTTAILMSSTVVATSSGTFTVTVKPGVNATTTVHIYEFSGMAASSVNDAHGSIASSGSPTSVTTSGTPVQAIELLFSTLLFSNTGTTITAGSGYTLLENDSGGTGSVIVDERETVTNANSGTQTATFSLSIAGQNWIQGIMTYKALVLPGFSKEKKLQKYDTL